MVSEVGAEFLPFMQGTSVEKFTDGAAIRPLDRVQDSRQLLLFR